MAAEHLEYLGLDPEQVRVTARFHEAYAETAFQEFEAISSAKAPTYGPVEDEMAFTLIADAASALREAGQWTLLLDPVRASQILRRSGDLFLQLGQAFGLYLGVVAAGSGYDADRDVLAQALRSASGLPIDRDQSRAASLRDPMPDIRLQQQQQAYLVMAASGVASRDEADDRSLNRFDPLDVSLAATLESSPHRSGVLPVGSLGTPIHRFWSVAEHLFRGQRTDTGGIAQHIAAMCRSYEEAISLARTNRYLWRNGAAPVDIADLDISGIAALTTRTFGEDALQDALAEVPGGRELSRLGRVPIELGIALATGPQGQLERI